MGWMEAKLGGLYKVTMHMGICVGGDVRNVMQRGCGYDITLG